MANAKAKLLIVDDEPTTRLLLTEIFANLGHPVRAAEDGFAALEEIRNEVPDILLSDLNMPRMSGFELLSVVRRKRPEIFVIASSGAFTGEEVPHGIAADAFHEKATGLRGLLETVSSAATLEPVREGSSESTPIWISPVRRDAMSEARVLISCQECLRSFSLSVGEADFLVHQTQCVYCESAIHYATVHPMDPEHPHSFQASRAELS